MKLPIATRNRLLKHSEDDWRMGYGDRVLTIHGPGKIVQNHNNGFFTVELDRNDGFNGVTHYLWREEIRLFERVGI